MKSVSRVAHKALSQGLQPHHPLTPPHRLTLLPIPFSPARGFRTSAAVANAVRPILHCYHPNSYKYYKLWRYFSY
jgi:hypothetical protein